jgi:hypothetical protein
MVEQHDQVHLQAVGAIANQPLRSAGLRMHLVPLPVGGRAEASLQSITRVTGLPAAAGQARVTAPPRRSACPGRTGTSSRRRGAWICRLCHPGGHAGISRLWRRGYARPGRSAYHEGRRGGAANAPRLPTAVSPRRRDDWRLRLYRSRRAAAQR